MSVHIERCSHLKVFTSWVVQLDIGGISKRSSHYRGFFSTCNFFHDGSGRNGDCSQYEVFKSMRCSYLKNPLKEYYHHITDILLFSHFSDSWLL